jgi:phosphonate transport system permease protein
MPGGSAAGQRHWERFTPRQRFARFLAQFALVAAVALSLRTVEIIPEFLLDAPAQVGDLFRRMWPMDVGFYQRGVHAPLLETLHMATLGTVLAAVLAVPLAHLAARNVTPCGWVNQLAKLALVSSFSVNSVVWALLFVAVLGPGPLAGTFAVGFRSIGFIGKLLGEALEEAHRGSIEALVATGAPLASVLRMGYWPQVKPAFWSVVLLRWDINVRESAVLGLVGAGGLGMALDAALNRFFWDRVATILLAILVMVVLAEILVTSIRKRIL